MSWDILLDTDVLNQFIKAETEDYQRIELFFGLIKERVEDFRIIASIAKKWDTFPIDKQTKMAINYAGIYHASRFIILMDYLNLKDKKGELL